jgi:hypothetical protein
MLTGQKRFSGETVSETMAAVMMKEPDWNARPANLAARGICCAFAWSRNRAIVCGFTRMD